MNKEVLEELREIKQLLISKKQVWNIDDFCNYTGISKPYVYHLTSSGKLKFYRPFGKIIFFDPEEVIESLKQNESKGEKGINSELSNYFLKHLN